MPERFARTVVCAVTTMIALAPAVQANNRTPADLYLESYRFTQIVAKCNWLDKSLIAAAEAINNINYMIVTRGAPAPEIAQFDAKLALSKNKAAVVSCALPPGFVQRASITVLQRSHEFLAIAVRLTTQLPQSLHGIDARDLDNINVTLNAQVSAANKDEWDKFSEPLIEQADILANLLCHKHRGSLSGKDAEKCDVPADNLLADTPIAEKTLAEVRLFAPKLTEFLTEQQSATAAKNQ